MSLREVVMIPNTITPLFVGREGSIKAIETALDDYEKQILLVTQKDPAMESPGVDDLYAVGTVSRILQMLRLPDGTIKVLFEGLYRARIGVSDAFEAEVPLVFPIPVPDEDGDGPEADVLVRAVQESLVEYAQVNKKLTKETLEALSGQSKPGKLADAALSHVRTGFERKQAALEEIHPVRRLEMVYGFLEEEVEVFSLEKKIKNRVKKQMEDNQKDYYLGEQLKAIHKEMGKDFDPKAEVLELETRLQEKVMPDEAREKALQEIQKLRMIPPASAEYSVVRNYVDWILELPWGELKEIEHDLPRAEEILNEDHFGLDKPKERILEYLAVQSLVEKMRGPILCLVGPPGVGKTSLAKSIARATGREYVRLSLGGVRDEAEIRGHRRTYVGAMPGKIIQSLKRVKSSNPLFCLDEVDKMSTDFRGDPSSALLEVLDPEQNSSFNDHYLDLDYDLSSVFFITTANYLQNIPLPLQDRMEIIELPGYLETEKAAIARDFLLPKQRTRHGLKEGNLHMDEQAVLEVIRRYTREAGVRSLERELAAICRKVTRRLVEEDALDREVSVDSEAVSGFLGIPKVRHGEREESPQIGVTTGLAWTQVGGELLMVEVALMPGNGKIEITGKLGDIMQESTRAALSYIRSRADLFGLRSDFYKEVDIHVHVPEGATPKDGPSAGITLGTSLTSALLGIPVRHDLAMTGEITLRGRVLPIGGLREKLLAAHRGRIRTVLIPAENKRDLEEVPEAIRNDIEIVPVEHMDEVLSKALLTESPESLFCGRKDVVPLSLGLLKKEYRHQPQ